jgi:hypothetical protein
MTNPIKYHRPHKPIKTTFMELLDELSSSTKDDAQVLAIVKNIFSSYKIRFTNTLAPVRLVGGDEKASQLRRANLGRRSSPWA